MEPSAPIRGTFVYAAWSVDLRRRGPFVRPSGQRRRFITQLRTVAERLRRSEGMAGVRCLESTFIVPVARHPEFDLMLLANGDGDVSFSVSEAIEASGLPMPSLLRTAVNNVRFGDTDSLEGPILLNHFTAGAASPEVAEVWTEISRWYSEVLGVTNSTLLEFTDEAPYVVMNYASVPGPVVRFMLDQVLRPSFHRNVSGRLRAVDARALPVFARRVDR